MLIKIILASILKDKTQKALAFLVCFLASLLLCAMLNITLSIGNEITKQLRSYGSNILVLPKGSSLSIEIGNKSYQPLKNKNYLSEADLHIIKEIFWKNNITALAPFLDGEVDFDLPEKSGGKRQAILSGTYFEKPIKIQDDDDFITGIKALYPLISVRGKWASDEGNEIMLGENFANKYKIQPGQKIKINGKEYGVAGIILHSNMDEKIIAPLHLAQALFHHPGAYSYAQVSALTIPENDLAQRARRDVGSLNQLEYDEWYCTAYVSSIAYQISEDLKGASAKAMNSISDAQNQVVQKIQSLMGVTSIICLVISSIAIASLMSASIHRRQKQIGLLKVLGASNFDIYLIFASENLIIALIAAIFGFGTGLGVSELIALSIFGGLIDCSFVALPIALIFAALIALLGCALPIKKISALLPAEVIYGR